jgi:hypothetical protein
MANALFDIDTGLRVGNNYWFSSNGNISTTGTIIAGNIQVTGATSVTNINIENTTYQQATNFSTANAWISGGAIGVNVTGAVAKISNLYVILGYADSFSTPNLVVTTSATVDGGAYGNVTTTQFGSLFAYAYGPNNYSIIQAWSQGTQGMGINAFGTQLYSSGGIAFRTGATVRDKDFPTGGTTDTSIAANGVLLTQGIRSANILMTGDITQSSTGTFTYAANTLPPKQYVDIMSIVFGS